MTQDSQGVRQRQTWKRKRDEAENDHDVEDVNKDTKFDRAVESTSGKRNIERNFKVRKPEEHDASIAKRDPSLLSDTFAQAIAKSKGKDSTSLEQSDLAIPSRAFCNTSEFGMSHIAMNLPAFLEKYVKGGREELSSSTETNSPHTVIVACSGMRVADLYREVVQFNEDGKVGKVGKFIAKHMKLKDNIRYLGETKVGIAISTPQRLVDLIQKDAVKLESLKRIVLDASYMDEKKRTLLTIDEVFVPLLHLLNMPAIKIRFGTDTADNIELMVF